LCVLGPPVVVFASCVCGSLGQCVCGEISGFASLTLCGFGLLVSPQDFSKPPPRINRPDKNQLIKEVEQLQKEISELQAAQQVAQKELTALSTSSSGNKVTNTNAHKRSK